MQPRRDAPVNDPPPCMYDYLRASVSGYSVITPQTTASVNNSLHFAPPVGCFPGNPPHEIIASDNQQQLKLYIQSLQKLLYNFAVYRFHCKLTTEICGSYLGQAHEQMILRKTRTGVTTYKDLTFHSHLAIKEQLKQAVTDLAQPLLTDLTTCSRCHIKHHKSQCMHFLFPKTNY